MMVRPAAPFDLSCYSSVSGHRVMSSAAVRGLTNLLPARLSGRILEMDVSLSTNKGHTATTPRGISNAGRKDTEGLFHRSKNFFGTVL